MSLWQQLCLLPQKPAKKSDCFERFSYPADILFLNIYTTGTQRPSVSEVGCCLHDILLSFQELHLANSLLSCSCLLANISEVRVRKVYPNLYVRSLDFSSVIIQSLDAIHHFKGIFWFRYSCCNCIKG